MKPIRKTVLILALLLVAAVSAGCRAALVSDAPGLVVKNITSFAAAASSGPNPTAEAPAGAAAGTETGFVVQAFDFRCFVTPDAAAVTALASGTDGVDAAYDAAIAWIYVPETTLHGAADRWLTPQQFLAGTPDFPENPLPGSQVSDCEEQANTLVSLLRAIGVGPEDVRVVLGEVVFKNATTGHAWVELLVDGEWTALDPSWGPYWDAAAGKLVPRPGVPFDYYRRHAFPVLQVWTYYNDVYQWDNAAASGYAPVSWRQDTAATDYAAACPVLLKLYL